MKNIIGVKKDKNGFNVYHVQKGWNKYYYLYFCGLVPYDRRMRYMENEYDVRLSKEAKEYGINFDIKPIYRKSISKNEWEQNVNKVREKWNNAEIVYVNGHLVLNHGIKKDEESFSEYGKLEIFYENSENFTKKYINYFMSFMEDQFDAFNDEDWKEIARRRQIYLKRMCKISSSQEEQNREAIKNQRIKDMTIYFNSKGIFAKS